ncbi:MAG: protein kinase [Phycisphaerales bacterium]
MSDRPASDTDRFDQIAELFEAARRLDPDEREAFLDSNCGADEALRHEIESLLAHHRDAGATFDSPIIQLSRVERGRPARQSRRGEKFGRYRIIRRLGSGGMGVVYLAEQDEPRRSVALKVLRGGLLSDTAVRRFRHESNLLGQLNHPGIAAVFDAGAAADPDDPDGPATPYFAMEYIEGVPLTRYADQARLDLNQRVTLMAEVGEAMRHAHDRGVVHRDLKPSNILVDANGRVKIVDFGVARALRSSDDRSTMHTHAGQLIGTLAYMSPEQASGAVDEIDQRSDVYALGVVLYELLTGHGPYELDATNPIESVRVIRDEEPQTLSATSRDYRGDLDTIMRKALAKEPARRYDDAGAFADDLKRYLRDEPITARPPSTWYQARKFAKRNQAMVAGVAAAFVLLLVTTIISASFAVQANRARRAESARAEEARRAAFIGNLAAAESALRDVDIIGAERFLDLITDEFRSRFEARRVRAQLDLSRLVISTKSETPISTGGGPMRHTPEAMIQTVEFTPDGATLVSGGNDRLVRVWDATTGEEIGRCSGHESSVQSVAVHPDGHEFASAADDGPLRIWSLADRVEVARLSDGDAGFTAVAYSYDGSLVAGGGADGVARVWRRDSGAQIARLPGHAQPIREVAFDPTGSLLATASSDGFAHLYDLSNATLVHVIDEHDGPVRSVAFSPDGGVLATAGLDKEIRLWNPSTGQSLRSLHGHSNLVHRAVFSADGSRIASCGAGFSVRLWNASDGALQVILPGHRNIVTDVSFDRWGARIASSAIDGTIRIWDTGLARPARPAPIASDSWRSISISGDGELAATSGLDGRVRLWSVSSGVELFQGEIGAPSQCVALDSEGRMLAIGGNDGRVRLVDLSLAKPLRVIEAHSSAVSAIEFDPTGEWILSGSSEGMLRRERVAAPDETQVFVAHEKSVAQIECRPDGSEFATIGIDGVLQVWPIDSIAQRLKVQAHPSYGSTVAWSPDGAFLLTGAYDGTARLWRSRDGAAAQEPWKLDSPVFRVDFHPSDDLVAIALNDGSIRFHDYTTGDATTIHRELSFPILDVRFTPAGDRLVAIETDQIVFLDTEPPVNRIDAEREFTAALDTMRQVVSDRLREFESAGAEAVQIESAGVFTETERRAALALLWRETIHFD